MPAHKPRVSSKGHVVVPKALRERKHLAPGTAVEFIDHPEGVLIRAVPGPSTGETLDALIGITGYAGPPKTLDDMQRGIDEALAERWRPRSQF